jgi:tetratricopeptide (TPR) repeat protein/predicted aspartyl protease
MVFGADNMNRRLLAGIFLAFAATAPALAAEQCKIGKLLELPVTMIGEKPVVSVKINGRDAQLVADSGAFYSMITHPNAVKYGLSLEPAPPSFKLEGVTGDAGVQIGTARDFGLEQANLHNIQFLVGGSEVGGGGTAGLLGQNVLHVGDVEYDLAHGAIRLFKAHDCGRTVLAYWVQPGQAYTVIPIDRTTQLEPHTMGVVYVNGVRLKAIFDTGASSSILSLHAAAQAGIRPDSPGVKSVGRSSGIGQRTVAVWAAPVSSFKIGDEEIKNTRLMIGEVELPDADMLVGADFFLSHRVFVATSQAKLYLTYGGGPVFNLMARAAPPPAVIANASPTPGVPAADTPPVAPGATADISAIDDAAPKDYELALVRVANHQPQLALANLNSALHLKPDHLDALVLRARLELAEGHKPAAVADLDAADKLAAKQDDVRLNLALGYEAAGQLAASIFQYDLWIAAHDDDYRIPNARNGRCWSRALLGQDLDKALSDCNAALRMTHSPAFLDSRGLVFLRRGELDRAIRDYDESLKLNPRTAWSFYGRGLAEQRKGMKAQADADIAAAIALAPKLPEEAKLHGIAPVALGATDTPAPRP